MTNVIGRRAKSACGPCHRRKRKCDGSEPCNTCTRDGYECHYRTPVRALNADSPSISSKTNPRPSDAPHVGDQRSVVANSGPLFMRQLLKKIDPSNVPTTQLSAWNVGPRVSPLEDQSQMAASIMNLVTQAQMTALAHVYFEKVDPCYGFIDRDAILQQIETRWLLPPYTPQSYDAVLCGVAAVGSYFSKAHAVPVEAQLVRLAKSILDSTTLSNAPDPDTVTAWVCHVIYLRLTATPSTAWLASCTAMHILEAAGAHRDVRNDEAFLTHPLTSQSSRMSRRAFGVAQHLNTWISYDIGLSRVSSQSPEALAESTDVGNYTDKLLQLLPDSLGLGNVANGDEAPLIMAQSNVVLCVLRQLSARNLLRTSGDNALDSALGFLRKGLQAARQMIVDDCPWHHLANVPFQTLCMLLAIDTPTSLAMVGDAMDTFQQVTKAYDTITLSEAYSTACMILYLHRKRRWDDAQIIDNVLSRLMNTEDTMLSVGTSDGDWTTATESEVSWFNSLMGEFPSLQTFNASDILDNHSLSQLN